MSKWNGCKCGEWNYQGACIKCGEHFPDQWDKLFNIKDGLHKHFLELQEPSVPVSELEAWLNGIAQNPEAVSHRAFIAIQDMVTKAKRGE